MESIGIDGCRDGWVLAVRASATSRVRFYVLPTIAPVLREVHAGRAVVAIDIPIGLPRSQPRACDAAARRLIGPRAPSVFSVPCRRAVYAKTDREARNINQSLMGMSISAQGLGILGKIREVDRAIRPVLQNRVRESHPEVMFTVLNGGVAMKSHKGKPEGAAARLALLVGRGLVFEPDRERCWLNAAVAEDDLIDAAACLLAAERIAARSLDLVVLPHTSIGVASQIDARGLRMEIVA